MPDLLHMAGVCEHGQDSLNQHPLVPGPALADLEVVRVALLFGCLDVEAAVAQNEHLAVVLLDHRLEDGVVNIGCFYSPVYHAPQVVKDKAEFSPDDPAVVGLALLADLFVAAALSPGMDQLDPEAVHHAKQRRLRQKMLCPVLMRGQKAKQAGALRQARKQRRKIGFGPAVEGAAADAFEGEQHSERDGFARMQQGLRMFFLVGHGIVNTDKQFRGKIMDGHRLGLALQVW